MSGVTVDVRGVEPRLRFDRIMGAYEELEVGQAMELAVDHDPSCMYYTLKATRGDEAFDFHYLQQGPETWRVRVVKREEVEAKAPAWGPNAAAPGPGRA